MNNLEQELMEEMLLGPITIYTCVVHYRDGSQRAFTFSVEQYLADFIEYIEQAGEDLNIVSYVYYQSLLDALYDHEYEFWTKEH